MTDTNILCGPQTHICWTPDSVPLAEQKLVVLVEYETYVKLLIGHGNMMKTEGFEVSVFADPLTFATARNSTGTTTGRVSSSTENVGNTPKTNLPIPRARQLFFDLIEIMNTRCPASNHAEITPTDEQIEYGERYIGLMINNGLKLHRVNPLRVYYGEDDYPEYAGWCHLDQLLDELWGN